MFLSSTDDSDFRSVTLLDGSLWPKLLVAALRLVRGVVVFARGKRRQKLVFVERPISGWKSVELEGKWIISLHSELAVTNPSEREGVVVVRVQIGRAGFIHRRTLQDCHWCYIAGEHLSPSVPGVLINSRTTATMQITHPFGVNRQPNEGIEAFSFRVTVTDQLGRRHATRIKLQRFPRNQRPAPLPLVAPAL
jgi:hypothetical protein